ncbi:MAG: hypothetical protein FWH07_07760, partial [Oscillospiraceae bacterium]|nr:hypothetical protein [Oscillospiraceae bacterium]
MIAEPVSDYINLLDPATKEVVGAVSPIYVYDSAEMPNVTFDNDMVIELRADGDYELTIVVDEAFLSDAETVYPVFVYPTVTVDVSGEGYKEIEDLGIYNTGAGNTPTGVARQIFFALGQN